MTVERPRRQRAIRLDVADDDAVRALAERETEGNGSMMLRKLVAEALAARSARPSPSNPEGTGV